MKLIAKTLEMYEIVDIIEKNNNNLKSIKEIIDYCNKRNIDIDDVYHRIPKYQEKRNNKELKNKMSEKNIVRFVKNEKIRVILLILSIPIIFLIIFCLDYFRIL